MKQAVILTYPRTGSNRLVSLLNAHRDFHFHGEIFNRDKVMTFSGKSVIERETGEKLLDIRSSDLRRFMRLAFSHPKRQLVCRGFKLFQHHDRAAIDYVISTPEIGLILLRRENYLATYSSASIAKTTGAWKSLAAAEGDGDVKVEFDPHAFDAYRRNLDHKLSQIRRKVAARDNVFFVDYTRINDPKLHIELVQFLGGSPDFVLDSRLDKQNPGRVIDRFANPQTVEAHLSSIGKSEWAITG